MLVSLLRMMIVIFVLQDLQVLRENKDLQVLQVHPERRENKVLQEYPPVSVQLAL
jgi:hypothetical protein